MTPPVQIGIFGMGNVGMGVIRLLDENRSLIEKKVGKPVCITKAVVANPAKERDVDLSDIQISNDAGHILNDPEIHIVLELVGGIDQARNIILTALEKGKSVVTANKALLAEKGGTIFSAAHKAGGYFGFETAVGTSIPIVRSLGHGFAGDEIQKISGILNGTSNYILSSMSQQGLGFEQALEQAQRTGLAEADPFLDVQGIDAAHKLIILMNIAFNGVFDFNRLYTEGITGITACDIHYTDQLGYTIKHLGKVRKTPKGIEARVHPVLVPKEHILSSVSGAFNSISVGGRFMGPAVLHGLGAGPGPSAVGVVGDIIEASRYMSTNGQPPNVPFGSPMEILPMGEIRSEYYLRFKVKDRLGVLSSISRLLAENHISVKSVIQQGGSPEAQEAVDIVILTHTALENDVQKAMRSINKEDFISGLTQLIRMEGDEDR